MARSHFIRDVATDSFFVAASPEVAIPRAKTKDQADLFTLEEAWGICSKRYGQNWQAKVELIPCTLHEHTMWRTQKASHTKSEHRSAVARKIGRKYGGRRRVCRSCAGPIEKDVPRSRHVCNKCNA